MKNKLFTIFAAALIAASSTMIAQTTPTNGGTPSTNATSTPCFAGAVVYNPQQLAGFTDDIVAQLGLTCAQIDTANTTAYAKFNYFATEYGIQLSDCDNQIQNLMYSNSSASNPQAAGAQIASLVTQLFYLQGQFNSLKATTTASLLAILTPAQQAKLNAWSNAYQSAQTTLQLVAEANYGILLPQVQQVGGGPNNFPSIQSSAVQGAIAGQSTRQLIQAVRAAGSSNQFVK